VASYDIGPYTQGHLKLARAAQETIIKMQGAEDGSEGNTASLMFEISVTNADKPPLSKSNINTRLEQLFHAQIPVVLTHSPLFIDKVKKLNSICYYLLIDLQERFDSHHLLFRRVYFQGASLWWEQTQRRGLLTKNITKMMSF